MSREDFIAQRADAKRRAIFAAARARFAADGFERASVEAIAEAAAVSTATLYRQFPSKILLFAAVLEAGAEDFARALDALPTTDPRVRLEGLAIAYARLLDDPVSAGVLRAALAAAPSTPEIAAHFYGKVKSVVGGAFQEAVARASTAGLITPSAADPLLYGGHLMGMIEHGTLWRRLLSGEAGEKTPDAIAEDALAAFWRAYGA